MANGYEVHEIKKYGYSVYSSRQESNEVVAEVMLNSDSKFLGYIHFLANESVLPRARKINNLFYLYYHQKEMPVIIDMLRNEKPLFLIFIDNELKSCRITTSQETVGEGED
jgi:hypothetical protein